jgi:urea carboxylase
VVCFPACQIFVRVGARVEEGEKLMVVVAMKMEVAVKATAAGVVEEIFVEETGKVVEGALLVKLAAS